jgi:pantetheine-phosphate adenylyltransferase
MTRRLVGVYAGTFDPVTNGHMDVIKRAMRVVDHLVVGVAINAGKGPMFSLDERVAMLEDDIAPIARGTDATVEVKSFRGLLVDFAVACGASVVVRGLRAVSDFEYEFQLTGMNAHLNPDIETVFLMASSDHLFIASRLVKEIAVLGGDITPFVSDRVRRRMMQKVAANKAAE